MTRTNNLLSALVASAALLLTMTPFAAEEQLERADIPAKYKWDLSAMYASAEAWEQDYASVSKKLPDLAQYRGHLADSGDSLLATIKAMEAITVVIDRLYVYSGLVSYQDLRNSEAAARLSRAQSLQSQYGETVAFFSPELLAIADTKLADMVSATPGLAPYRHYLNEESRLKPYTLSNKEEKLLAMASDPLNKFQNVFSALDNADLSFGEMKNEEGNLVELTQGRYTSFLFSTDRRVREDAWVGLFTAYEAMGNTLAANYEGHVKSRVFNARARGYDSAQQAATYASAIPESVYINLISTVRSGAPALQKYLRLRREALNVETLEVWDLYAPLVAPTYSNIPWEDAQQIVADGLAPLGKEYLDLYWLGFKDGWVDPLENKGKRSGAYSWGSFDSKPYFAMNYEGTLSDVSTLAHEYGHSIHSYLTRQTQPYIYGYYRTFIAEIASMTNEAILQRKMLEEAKTPQERAYLLQSYLDGVRSSFFRQASFADFEMQAHAAVEAGEALTKDSLNTIYAEVFQAYYGDAVNKHPLNASEWSRIPHFLRTDNFYVYQYATSFVAANALAKNILEEGEPARERFLDMLRAGSSDYPIELLKKAGVDMTTTQPILDALAEFSTLVDQLEVELKAI